MSGASNPAAGGTANNNSRPEQQQRTSTTSFLPIKEPIGNQSGQVPMIRTFGTSPNPTAMPVPLRKRQAPPVPPKKRPVSMPNAAAVANAAAGGTTPTSSNHMDFSMILNPVVRDSRNHVGNSVINGSNHTSGQYPVDLNPNYMGATADRSPKDRTHSVDIERNKVSSADRNPSINNSGNPMGHNSTIYSRKPVGNKPGGRKSVENNAAGRRTPVGKMESPSQSSQQSPRDHSQGITVPGMSSPVPQEMTHVNKRHTMPASVGNNSLPLGYGGWSPTKHVATVSAGLAPKESAEDARQKAQVKAYVAWVNAQLRKKPGAHMVEDLKCDMQDGVALANLIEIVAGEWLEGIHPSPSTSGEMLENVERVIMFMTQRRIRMHQTTSRDIVEGNLKSIMRLILALAAHFKPNSVKQSSQGSHDSQRAVLQRQSMAGIAHGAAAALAEARRDAACVSQRPRRPKQLRQDDNRFHGSGTGSDSDHSHGDMGYHGYVGARVRLDTGASTGSSPAGSGRSSPKGSLSPRVQRKLEFGGLTKSKSQDFEPGHMQPERGAPPTVGVVMEEEAYSILVDDHNVISDDMEDTKKTLLKLQELLLSGSPPDGEESMESPLPLEATNAEEEVIVLRSKLQQSEELCKEVKEELSRVKNECMQLQGVRGGLHKRLSEQESAFLAMKAELLRSGFCQQGLENSKADLEHRVTERDKLILELRRELARCERELDEIKSSFHIHYQEKHNTAATMKGQIHELHERLKLVGDTEVNLSAKVASQDRKMARLENRILSSQCDNSSRASSVRSVHSTGSDDLQVVRDSLRSLRTRFPGEDPQHHNIDTLEQSISSLMEKLHVNEQSSHNRSDSSSSRRMNYDSTGDVRRSPITALTGFPVQRLDSSQTNGNCNTKLLYFTDRTVTPFMCSIPRRLGEITLRDIKAITDRQGNYRYHFKALDPEFGTVKEEVTHDDDIIPGWEGKIVAWIEEDHG